MLKIYKRQFQPSASCNQKYNYEFSYANITIISSAKILKQHAEYYKEALSRAGYKGRINFENCEILNNNSTYANKVQYTVNSNDINKRITSLKEKHQKQRKDRRETDITQKERIKWNTGKHNHNAQQMEETKQKVQKYGVTMV